MGELVALAEIVEVGVDFLGESVEFEHWFH